MRVFGSLCYATNLKKTDKFCPRVVPIVHLCYSPVHKGYVLYDLSSQLFFVSRNIVFREDIFPFKPLHTVPSPLFPVLELRDVECPALHNLSSFDSLSPFATPCPSITLLLSDYSSPFLSSLPSLPITDHSYSPLFLLMLFLV